jgi:hypothetical protein
MFKSVTRTGGLKGRKGLKAAAVIAATATALVVAPSTQAQAISMPDPFSCAWNVNFGGGDYLYLKIRTTNQAAPWTPLCYQDAGTKWDMNVTNVAGLHSGNNAGIINSDTILWAFPKWHDDFTFYGTVKVLTIYQ